MVNGGILLCGGYGTRLLPTTKYINKHLIPIYDKPMVYYSLSILLLSGIKDITIICNAEEEEVFFELLGTGEEFGVSFNYVKQDSPLGIPQAIDLSFATPITNPFFPANKFVIASANLSQISTNC